MAIEFGKGIALAGGFDLGAKAPLDSRLAVATIADRDAHVTGNRAYEGMLVYVEENKVTYQYIADAEGNLTWKEFGFNLADFQGQVINNLESDDTTKALSAAQGKALKALIDEEAETAREAEEANADAIATLDEKVGVIPTDEEGNAVAETVVAYVDQKVAAEAEIARAAEKANADAIKAITDDYLVEADKTELQGNIDEVVDKVTTLIGEDADKSVRTIANEELAKQLIAEGAKEALDSLEEIAAWIQEHPDDAAAMNKAIEDLEALIGELPEDVTATTIVGFIQEAVKAEEDRAKLAEQGLDERLQEIEAKFEGDESVEKQIATAKQEAIDAAKEYADGLDKAMDERVDALEDDTHTHANKDELDKIVDGDKAKWDAAEAKAHEHANKALLDTYTQTEEDLADAVAKKHAHENADVLAGITAAQVEAWDKAEQNAKEYAEEKVDELANGTVSEHTTEINSLDERVDVLEAKFTGDNSVENKINASLTEAKGYTDTEVAKDREKITALEEASATHAKQADLEKEIKDRADADAAIEAKIGEIAEDTTVAQMIADVQDALQDEIDRAKEAEGKALTDAKAYTDAEVLLDRNRLDELEAKFEGENSVEAKIDAAKEEAIETAAGDATTKANTAEQNAKDYADGLNTAMNTRVEALEAIDHDHANKAELDKIQEGDKAKWDAAEQNAKDYAKEYADGLDEAMDVRVKALEAIDHEHANADVINAITAEQVAAWDKAEENAKAAVTELANGAVKENTEAIAALEGTHATDKAALSAKDTELENAIAALTKTHNDDKAAIQEDITSLEAALAAIEEITEDEISALFA